MSASRLLQLPVELILVIVEQLDKHDLISFSRASHRAAKVCQPLIKSLSPEQRRKLFLSAAETGREVTVTYFIDELFAVNKPGSETDESVSAFRDSALNVACRGGIVSIIRHLLGAGAEPRPSHLETAVKANRVEAVRLLFSLGVDIESFRAWSDERNERTGRESILHVAAQAGSTDVVEMLLSSDYGLDVGRCDALGFTALWKAAFRGYSDTVAVLLRHDANPNQCLNARRPAERASDSNGYSYACIVDYILGPGAGPQPEPETGRPATALWAAAVNDQRHTTELLLNHGARLDLGTPTDCSVLHDAAVRGCRSIIPLLLAQGADINERNPRGYGILHYVLRRGYTQVEETVQALLDGGADINGTTAAGDTVLSIAAIYAPYAVLQLLIDRGADLDKASADGGKSPLFYALESLSYGAASMLVRAGCDVEMRDKTGKAPIDYTFGAPPEIIELIRSRSASASDD